MLRNRSLLSIFPAVVGAVSLGITAWLWTHEQQASQRTLKADFDFSVRQTASRIEQRMASYEQMLRGVQGLFRASDRVDGERFAAYVDALLAGADFVGIQLLAYAPLVQRGGEVFTPILYAAPATGARRRAVGADPYADPVRRVAMLQSRDSGGIGVTPIVALPGDPSGGAQSSFLMFLPVYANGKAVDSLTARRAAVAGWVHARVRMSDVMSSLYGEGTPGIAVRIFDGVTLNRQALMYESVGESTTPPAARLTAQEYIGFAGHTWTLSVTALPAFEQQYGSDSSRIIVVAGVGFSLLLALLTHQLVTGRARAHEAARSMTRELRDSEERYRLIVENADEGIWVFDARGRTSFVNPKMAQLLGYDAGEILGRTLDDFIGSAQRTQAAQDGAGLPSDAAGRREVEFRRKDGSALWTLMATTPILDPADHHTGALALVTDITETRQADATRVQLEAQLRESQKMEAIGTLAGGIAHDFNNILAAILGNVALAQEQVATSDAACSSLEQIAAAAARARSLVQQILAFSRRQPHKLVSQPLRPLIEESVRLLRPILPALVEIELTLADAPLEVEADETRLQQVMINLCTNAWHALKGGAGRITIGLDAADLDATSAQRLGVSPGRHAHVWVSDNGCGMDEATRARVFEPFFTTKPVGQGTGLGLSVAHGIVAAHHGAIAVDSKPGQGSRFDLYFPLRASRAVVAPPSAMTTEPPRSHGQHVLYVDDDPVMGLMVQGLLQRSGYSVTCFDDPREALEALRAQTVAFDLVVTDYNMPGLSGLDVARELARLRPGLPVVISSGFVTEEVLAQSRRLGVRSVLQKEYTLEKLVDTVHLALAEAPRPAA